MTDWLSGVDPADVVRVEIVRVTLEGSPSCVTHAVFRLHLVDGSSRLRETALPDPKIYETFVDDVAGLNRMLAR